MCAQPRGHAAAGAGHPQSRRSSAGCRFGSKPPWMGGRRCQPALQAAWEGLSQGWSFPCHLLSHLAHVARLQRGSALVFLHDFVGKPGCEVLVVHQLAVPCPPALLAPCLAVPRSCGSGIARSHLSCHRVLSSRGPRETPLPPRGAMGGVCVMRVWGRGRGSIKSCCSPREVECPGDFL